MSSGLRYKFQGSHISILTGFDADSPPDAITNITAADPPVVTSAGHGRSNGDIVKIANVVGMTQVNDGVFIVANKTTNTFELYGVKGVNYSAYVSGGTFEFGAWSEFCEVTNWNRTGGTKPTIPANSVCSEEDEYEVGIGGKGQTNLAFNYAPDTAAAQIALEDWDDSGDVMAVKRQLPKNGGTRIYAGFVIQQSETGGVGGLWTASAVIQNTGPSYKVPA